MGPPENIAGFGAVVLIGEGGSDPQRGEACAIIRPDRKR